ncbi:predicted protein [Plenodomus lingam JN3]|uniref:Uncharacterized protein n=1 Tax=Leptosphaeria maculans (strain JN3 / isolate v23.1.3 / race Av1-4-5-6-7-8) TaxID=985895 RepID=E5A6J7_LEPMJ|nr:predicted protein [Plenodomus lingam JN3]CBX99242.1 predicted protein [Plenodomus lingam JN3]
MPIMWPGSTWPIHRHKPACGHGGRSRTSHRVESQQCYGAVQYRLSAIVMTILKNHIPKALMLLMQKTSCGSGYHITYDCKCWDKAMPTGAGTQSTLDE